MVSQSQGSLIYLGWEKPNWKKGF